MTTQTCSLQNNAELSTTLFEQPSGNVRGMVTALMEVKGKQRRIVHATLLVDGPPVVVLDVPKKMTVSEVDELSKHLKSFSEKLSELADSTSSNPV